MKKRVLHVLVSNKFSGAENVVCSIIENCNNYEMFYCSPKGPILKELEKRNINFIPLNKISPKELNRIVKEYQIDIIHAHDYKASFITALTHNRCKKISHLHNNTQFAKKWNIYTLLYALCSRKFDHIIGVSNQVFNEAKYKNYINKKYTTIYNCIDLENIILKSKEKYDKKYDLFFIGRITEQKNPLKLITIVEELHKDYKNIKVVIIGNGDLMDKLKKSIKEKGLEKNIDIVGYQENPYRIIKNSRIGLMPSKWEGFGLTAVESLALGKPVLNTFNGGLGEIFKYDKDFSLTCSNIKKLLNNKDEYDKLSKKSIQISKEFTNKDKFKKEIELIYKEVLNDNSINSKL